MLASITPLGERGRDASWRRTVTAYLLASTLGGAALGCVLGALGSVLPRLPLLMIGATAAVAAALDVSHRLPTIRRQVDERWLVAYRDWVYGIGFGAQLGFGAVTIVSSASLYLAWLFEVAVANPGLAAIVGATFGLARALPLLTTARATDPTRLRSLHRHWQQALPVARIATVGGQLCVAGVLIVVAAA